MKEFEEALPSSFLLLELLLELLEKGKKKTSITYVFPSSDDFVLGQNTDLLLYLLMILKKIKENTGHFLKAIYGSGGNKIFKCL